MKTLFFLSTNNFIALYFVFILTHTTPFITYINGLLFSILLNDKKDVSLSMSFGHSWHLIKSEMATEQISFNTHMYWQCLQNIHPIVTQSTRRLNLSCRSTKVHTQLCCGVSRPLVVCVMFYAPLFVFLDILFWWLCCLAFDLPPLYL